MLLDSITLFSSPSPSHCCTRPLKFAADCRLTHSARPLKSHRTTNQLPPVPRISAPYQGCTAVQQFTRISNRRISSYKEGFGILEIPSCFALRSFRCCVNTVPSRAKPLGPLQRFSQWLLNNPAFSAITCGTSYLCTWKSKSSNKPNQILLPGQFEQTLPNQWRHHEQGRGAWTMSPGTMVLGGSQGFWRSKLSVQSRANVSSD